MKASAVTGEPGTTAGISSRSVLPAVGRGGEGSGEEFSYGILLRTFRQTAGLTIEELSHASGVSVRAIGDMERGVSRGPQRRRRRARPQVVSRGRGRRVG
ncbi:helix-turn-helix domain-containing protein [Nonomuraea phyllanthi]|uniref:Helix-turn-helix domain-containing protein n=2 Tax=Nonomuraea phyllanthi TaxID=2219224 RepID=A0A5C4WN08_9ACTN|nr:helix-turn-helix domain-containing protein [Nonomuraea phyllanthi]QFY09142.1 helix-turn-helix domain-containing protein [Nonomuraea phyllanthi]